MTTILTGRLKDAAMQARIDAIKRTIRADKASVEEKQIAVELWDGGLAYAEIGHVLTRSVATVGKWVRGAKAEEARRAAGGNTKFWRDDAACLGADPELFFPNEKDTVSVRAALEYCDTCPVKAACLIEAKASGAQGIWGGQNLNIKPKETSDE